MQAGYLPGDIRPGRRVRMHRGRCNSRSLTNDYKGKEMELEETFCTCGDDDFDQFIDCIYCQCETDTPRTSWVGTTTRLGREKHSI